MVAIGVEEQGLFQLIEDKNSGLVQQKVGCNFIENSAIVPRLERCQKS